MNCNAHCRSCGRHFSSTSAFDRHRTGPWDDRRCESPLDVERLYEYEGDCTIAGGDEQVGVKVYSTKAGE